MTVRTRYFVIVSLLVVGVGLGTGLLAYYVGFPTSAFLVTGGPEELRYLPSTSAVVAYADVREVMASELRQRFRESIASDAQENGQREFQELTGINIETDIDRVVASFDASSTTTNRMGTGVVLARGRFDEVKIESLMREHGARRGGLQGQASDHGRNAKTADAPGHPDPEYRCSPDSPDPPELFAEFRRDRPRRSGHHRSRAARRGPAQRRRRQRIDQRGPDGTGEGAWDWQRLGGRPFRRAAGTGPSARSSCRQAPPITWFAVSGRINGGIEALLSAEARDEVSANNLRDVVRGFLALAKLQTRAKPEYQRFVDSLQLSGTGNIVALSVDVPAQMFDALRAAMPKPPPRKE